MRRLAFAVLVLSLLSLLAACGGGGNGGKAADALLAVGDFPAGWSKAPAEEEGEEEEEDNDFCEALNPDDEVKPVDEAEAEFQNSQGGLLATHAVALYDDVSKAREVMELLKKGVDECKTFTTTQGGETFNGTMTAAPKPSVGEDAVAAKLTATTQGVTVNADIVMVRQGRGVTVVVHFGLKPEAGLAESLAGKAADKLKAEAA